LLQPFRQPHLDDRLAHDAQPPGISIQRDDHPGGKINVNAPGFFSGAAGFFNIQLGEYVFTVIKFLVKLEAFIEFNLFIIA
jgi:hypothetical protein